MNANITTVLYLVSAALFIVGIKQLGSPATARRGNRIAAVGMLLALVVTVLSLNITGWAFIIPAMVVGAVIGAASARMVRMTAMPQMVALFNGMGAGAAALIGAGDFRDATAAGTITTILAVTIVIASFIGCLSFSGSLIAFGKLQELISGKPLVYPLQKPLNGLILLGIIALGVFVIISHSVAAFVALIAATLILGVLFVMPVGGADMPVIISLLNSFTGLAAAATGFVLSNNVLIVSGALVGASGTLLTLAMSKAMNRSLFNVLFGSFGAAVAGPEGEVTGTVRPTTVDDLAPMLAYASQVVFVPGYGLAVARAQHDVKELADELEKRGVTVKYAIHPVAGRMPGHMNVLLAEADVPYTQLKEMDEINPEFPRTDVAVVIGANDVVNPAAKNQPGSPLYGMPILNVDEAKTVVVLKRSMNPGFAGVENPLFYEPNTMMLFGNARDTVAQLAAAVKHQ